MSPFVRLTQEGMAVRRRRMLISGEPNTRKTSALLTLPKPLAILSFPGEKGYDTIPQNDPDILPFIWELPEDGKGVDSNLIVKQVIDASVDLITGKHGKINAFAGDGLHKLIEYMLDAVTDGSYMLGEEFEAKLYVRAYNMFTDYLSRTMHSMIPVVAFTTWAEPEKDRAKKKGENDSDIPSHIYPALPGKLAKKIIGEFSVVVHQTLKAPKPGEDPIGVWQTRPKGDVWGCGLKGPVEIVRRIPDFIQADYRVLEAFWARAEAEAAAAKAQPAEEKKA